MIKTQTTDIWVTNEYIRVTYGGHMSSTSDIRMSYDPFKNYENTFYWI